MEKDMGKRITQKEAQKIIDRYIKDTPNTEKSSYVGMIENEYIFYVQKTIKVNGHIGYPLYFSVDKKGKVERLLPPYLFQVMKLHNKENN